MRLAILIICLPQDASHPDAGLLRLASIGALNGSRARMPAANVPAAMSVLQRSAERVQQAWDLCVEHGTLAEYLMDRLIFNRWPNIWHRLRMHWWPNDLDRRSKHLLITGSILGALACHEVDVVV